MNILQISTLDKKGGAAKVAYALKKELERRGHQTSMFVARKYSDEDNVKILNNVRSFSGRIRKKLAFYLANDIDVFSSDHILETEEFKKSDIVHCHNLHGNYFNLNTLTKISALKPVIWTFHDMWPFTPHCAHAFNGQVKNGFFQCPSLDIYSPIAWHNEKYLMWRKRSIYRKSDFHIVTPSRWLKNKVGQSVLKDKPISIIYNGIDTNIFNPIPQKQALKNLDLPLNKKIILFIAKGGPDNPWKGWHYFKEITEKLISDDNILFLSVGHKEKNTTRIQNLDFIADEKLLAKYYAASDLLLYPSLADNCPLAVLEAMSCGLPVVSFNTGGISELVEHKRNGYIAEYKNREDLLSGVKYILGLEAKRNEIMRKENTEKIRENFTKEIMTDKYLGLYKKITG